MTDTADLAVWWLRPDTIKQLVSDGGETRDLWRILSVPEYIGRELHSAMGRAGRGRLWPAGGIECDNLPWDDTHPNAAYCREAAGIVCWRRDVGGLCWLPGLLTDFGLDTLPEWTSATGRPHATRPAWAYHPTLTPTGEALRKHTTQRQNGATDA